MVDFQALNTHALRKTHHTQSPFQQSCSVPHGTKKTVFDAWNGYHTVSIREKDRHLTKFITPSGRYRYRTASQGYIASGDGYMRRFDEIVSEIQRKQCVWLMPYFWETILKRASSRHAIDLKLAEIMESHLILISLYSPKTVLNLLAL